MEALEKYLEERKEAISSILKQPRHEYTHETFHKLRVEIKRINALFDLIDFCFKDFKRKKTFKPFRMIFRQAGKVRELQVEETILHDYCDDSCLIDFQNRLKKEQLKEELNFFLIVNKKVIARLNKKFRVINSFVSDLKEKKSEGYMVKKSKEISKDLGKKTIIPKRIHELRKLVKLFIYNIDGLDIEREVSFVEKKALAELLGQWHDLRVIVRHLKALEKTKGIKKEERGQLDAIINELKEESELLFSEINLAFPKSC